MPTLEEITFNVEEIASDSGGGIEISSLECSFYEDLGYDSLDLVDFMMKVEGEFGIEIDDQYYEKLPRILDVIKISEELVKEKYRVQ